ncbi:MAG: TolC family protein [Magnetococcus sp. DMHC-6]
MKILIEKMHLQSGLSQTSRMLFWAICVAFSVAGCAVQIPAITSTEQAQLASQDQQALFKGQEALSAPLTLHEAMARAIKYNLDMRLKRQEEALAKKQEELLRLDMLPQLTAAAGYSNRTSDNGSVSQSLTTGLVSEDPTTSRGRESMTSDLTVSWNLLDFGVSYFYARQAGNKQFIQVQQRRKAIHNLIKDVRSAFWKAVVAQRLEREIGIIINSCEEALELARKEEKESLRSPVLSLQYQLSLLEMVRQLEKSRAELGMAKEELAVLINVEPGLSFQLVDDSSQLEVIPKLAMPITEMEAMALSSRPELRIEHYQSRIEVDETRKAIVRLFPGLSFDVSENYDNNAFLVYQHWAQAGARLSWNLIRILSGQQQMDLAEDRENVGQTQRLVLHMAILSQIRLAFQEYQSAQVNLQRLLVENKTRQRLQGHVANRSTLGLDSQLAFVQSATTAALGRVQEYEALSRYQNGLGRLFATLGLDPLSGEVDNLDLPQLVRQLRENELQWQQMVFHSSNRLSISNADGMAPLPLNLLKPKKANSLQKTGTSSVAKRRSTLKSMLMVVQESAFAEEVKNQIKTMPAQSTPQPLLRYAVQVAAFSEGDLEKEKMLASLVKKGYQPYIHKWTDTDGQKWHSIWLGRYSAGDAAIAVRDEYQKKEHLPAFIKEIDPS